MSATISSINYCPVKSISFQTIEKCEIKKNIGIIGDRISDIIAGENAGIKGGVYLNEKNNKHVSKSNFILKHKDNLEGLNWLIDDLRNSCF